MKEERGELGTREASNRPKRVRGINERKKKNEKPARGRIERKNHRQSVWLNSFFSLRAAERNVCVCHDGRSHKCAIMLLILLRFAPLFRRARLVASPHNAFVLISDRMGKSHYPLLLNNYKNEAQLASSLGVVEDF